MSDCYIRAALASHLAHEVAKAVHPLHTLSPREEQVMCSRTTAGLVRYTLGNGLAE